MKLLTLIGLMAVTLSCNAGTTAAKKTLPMPKFDAKKVDAAVKADNKGAKKEEDCDEKAKKPIEIKEESISLTGNTGCSLDEAK